MASLSAKRLQQMNLLAASVVDEVESGRSSVGAGEAPTVAPPVAPPSGTPPVATANGGVLSNLSKVMKAAERDAKTMRRQRALQLSKSFLVYSAITFCVTLLLLLAIRPSFVYARVDAWSGPQLSPTRVLVISLSSSLLVFLACWLHEWFPVLAPTVT